MRIRVLTYTSKGKLLAIADEVTKLVDADKATDVIPPAYPCDGERLVVIVATPKATLPESVQRTLRSFKRSVTHNVAFILDGAPDTAEAKAIIEMAKTNDSHVIEDNVLYINGGLPFKFLKSVKPEEMAQVTEWVKAIKAAMV